MEKKWCGTWPAQCGICGLPLDKFTFFCDARTDMGSWTLVCPQCHGYYCSGRLGVGSGQKYDSKTLVKIGG